VLLGFLTLFIACNDDDEASLSPVLTTRNITEVTNSSAKSGGTNITDEGSAITSRGVSWSTHPDPTISDFFTVDGNGTDDFESSLTTLIPSTTYYIRAYASNSVGTTYGNELSFSTTPYVYYSKIASGSEHSLAIKTDGSLWAWGSNETGQVGDGTVANRISPVRIEHGFTTLAGNGYTFSVSTTNSFGFTLAVKSDGSLWTWGSNAFGQLGNGSIIDRKSPGLISYGYSKVAAGETHALGLKTDGTLWAWGNNSEGQLGDDTQVDSDVPKQVGLDYAVIAAGGHHSLALKPDGSLWAWGDNIYGQLGDGTVNFKDVPTPIGMGYAAIAAGDGHTMALKTDGTLWAWGNNNDGQLGDGTLLQQTSPIEIGSGYAFIAAGGQHSLALKTDGTLWAWGNNSAGQIGDGTTTDKTSPIEIGSGYIAIAAGDTHSLALKADGTLWGWGLNYWGQLGNDSKVNQLRPILIGPR